MLDATYPERKECVCVCVRERERERERQTDRQTVCGEGEKIQIGKQMGYQMLKCESG